MSNVIEIKGLKKAYSKKNFALEHLDMTVPKGVIYGLLGRNGAGKTTTIRIMMNLLKASSGDIKVLGHNPEKMPLNIRQKIGYASDSMQLIPWLKIGEIINYNGSFYDNWDNSYVEKWVKRLELPLDKRVFSLSRGNRQKLALIMAIGHRPDLVILDEPVGGLDPVARKEFLESIIELIHDSGTTIVISSHLLSDLERISDYIGIIDQGQMKEELSLENLKSHTRRVKIVSSISEKLPHTDLIKSEKQGNSLVAVYKNWNEIKLNEIKKLFSNTVVETESLSLEEIFIAYTN